jgi:hypothetical protein
MVMAKKTKAEQQNNASAAAKAALGILGIGMVAGTALVVGMDRVMKKIFVNEDWPEEEWSADDYAEEELDN